MTLKDKIQLNKITHSVRASQAVLQYGVGAMVDFPEQTLMTAAPEFWSESVEEIHDERLEKALHVDYFGMPGSKDDRKFQNGIAYARFPEWYFCPKCRKFQSLKEWVKEYNESPKFRKANESDPYMVKQVRCTKCFQDLVVARIVVACGHGHIDDFPWTKWVHAKNSAGPKQICSKPTLRFTTSASSTEGLEGLSISCTMCGARATLKGAFDKDALKSLDEKTGYKYGFQCTGRHPWKNTWENCGEYPHVLQRGGSSVYFPILVSSLVIPPYSSMLTSKIESSAAFSDLRKAIRTAIKTLIDIGITNQESKDVAINKQLSEYTAIIAKEIGKSEEQVRSVLERRWSDNADEIVANGVKYRAEEYVALNGEVSVDDPNGEFIREDIDISAYGIPFVKGISLIHKIREVEALVAFSRLEPVDIDTEAEGEKIKKIPIKDSETNWYPGYDVRGEGIFIEFDSEAIDAWRTQNTFVADRVEQTNENYKKSFYGSKKKREITAKFLLLHTLSHLLMKQLSFECGYNIASIKERIYCSEEKDGICMSGILIYTASGDSEGTMGGLVRQGRPDTFPRIFRKAILSALTCSNDPVCSLSMGQGRDSLNLSACYSCTLVPETSCEEYNVFLDRGMVVGTFEHPNFGFYSRFAALPDIPVEKVNIHKKKSVQRPENEIIVTEYGADRSGVPFADIWRNLMQFSTDKTEIKVLEELLAHSRMFDRKERPCQSGSFQIGLSFDQYDVDLIWKQARLMLFTEGNKEEYELASKCGTWKCILLSDKAVTWESVLNELGE